MHACFKSSEFTNILFLVTINVLEDISFVRIILISGDLIFISVNVINLSSVQPGYILNW